MIKVIIDGKQQTERESQRMIKSFWKFCHGKCCKNKIINYDEMEEWFMNMHEDYDDYPDCDIYQYRMVWF